MIVLRRTAMRIRANLKMPTCAQTVGLMATFAALSLGGVSPAWAGHGGDCAALHEAAFLDEPDEARVLLTHGVDVNCLDVLGQTPLVTAVNGASLETFDLLLAAGANVDVRTEFGQSLLAHTKKKYASFSVQGGGNFRTLFSTMVARLQSAGAPQ